MSFADIIFSFSAKRYKLDHFLQVKVMLRVGPSFPGEKGSFMKADTKRKQVTLYDPSTVGHVSHTHRKMGVAAPKMFVYDAIFESDTSQVGKRQP